MGWSPLGTQFCMELGFGVLAALAFVPRAPVGVLFYRIMGTTAMVPMAVALAMLLTVQGASWTSPTVLFALLSLAGYPVYSGPTRGVKWGVGLGVGLLGAGAALSTSLAESAIAGSPTDEFAGVGALALASLSALATGTVAGSVALAMVLGHWYLTVPNLQIRHLVRLNRVTIASMALSLLLIGVSCLVFADHFARTEPPLLGTWGLFHLGTRIAVGLVLPLVFAWMAASSLRFENTRSATGILYASTVLVLIGAAVSISLQDSYGVPL
jgi:hypothetical protein